MITFEEVTKFYLPDLKAVDNVSLFVVEGTILCLIGMSGSGKTTLLKMINRLVEPSSGRILIRGENILDQDPIELRKSIGYVIQDAGLLPHLTVEKNIWLLQEVNGVEKRIYRKRCHELMELVGLNPDIFAKRYPWELSGGQIQRVGIARALMNDPPILLMDEPFGALDPITRKRLQEELLELNRQLNKTILLVTHDLTEAFHLGDELVLLQRGKVLQKGKKSEFLERPANSAVQEFVESQTGAGRA